MVIGSNDGETQSSAVHTLVDVLGLPRRNALLGVVSYADGFFHPKTIYLCYRSGREVAYVGSANMTARGINGLNIEAGIVLDTDDGDPAEILACVGRAAPEWFATRPQGFFEVESHEDVDRLARNGILATKRAPRRSHANADGLGHPSFPQRKHRHALPPLARHGGAEAEGAEQVSSEESRLDDPILIAELAGPGRWGQAAFPEWFINNYFDVLPETGDALHLWPVTETEGVGEREEARCGFKEGSRNWYYELGLAADMGTYPQPPQKPISVFHRIGHQTFRYTILMPDDESYPHVAGCLAANLYRLNRPDNELPRTIVPAVVLRDAWPDNWFFGLAK